MCHSHNTFCLVQYVLFGAEEGLFSLLVTDNRDPEMEQVQHTFYNNIDVHAGLELPVKLVWLWHNHYFA